MFGARSCSSLSFRRAAASCRAWGSCGGGLLGRLGAVGEGTLQLSLGLLGAGWRAARASSAAATWASNAARRSSLVPRGILPGFGSCCRSAALARDRAASCSASLARDSALATASSRSCCAAATRSSTARAASSRIFSARLQVCGHAGTVQLRTGRLRGLPRPRPRPARRPWPGTLRRPPRRPAPAARRPPRSAASRWAAAARACAAAASCSAVVVAASASASRASAARNAAERASAASARWRRCAPARLPERRTPGGPAPPARPPGHPARPAPDAAGTRSAPYLLAGHQFRRAAITRLSRRPRLPRPRLILAAGIRAPGDLLSGVGHRQAPFRSMTKPNRGHPRWPTGASWQTGDRTAGQRTRWTGSTVHQTARICPWTGGVCPRPGEQLSPRDRARRAAFRRSDSAGGRGSAARCAGRSAAMHSAPHLRPRTAVVPVLLARSWHASSRCASDIPP